MSVYILTVWIGIQQVHFTTSDECFMTRKDVQLTFLKNAGRNFQADVNTVALLQHYQITF